MLTSLPSDALNIAASKCSRILLIDGSPNDILFEEYALEEIVPKGSSINTVSSGDEAVQYMIGEGKFADRERYPFPTLIITELRMTKGDGFDVLEFIAHNPAWSVVPRIVFTVQSDGDDVRTAFVLGASAYHLKPSSLDGLKAQMRSILEYWATSETPPVDKMGRAVQTESRGRIGGRYAKPIGGLEMKRP